MTAQGGAPYRTLFNPAALDEWHALDPTIRAQLKEKLGERRANPRNPKAALSGDLAGCYKIKLRRAGYRLIYKVNDAERSMTVLCVGKRADSAAYSMASRRLAAILVGTAVKK